MNQLPLSSDENNKLMEMMAAHTPSWEIATWLINTCHLSISQAREVRKTAIELFKANVNSPAKENPESQETPAEGSLEAEATPGASPEVQATSEADAEDSKECPKCGRYREYCGCEIDPSKIPF